MSLSQGSGDPEQWRVLLHQETQNLREELRREMREQLGEQPNLEQLLSGNLGQARVPPELLRSFTSATPVGAPSLLPRPAWSRHVSDGKTGSEPDDSELFEWHRHPRLVRPPRSNSSSPSNRFRYRHHGHGRAASKHGSPHRQKNSLLPPHMPEEATLIRSSRRFSQMSNPLLIREVRSPAHQSWSLRALVESSLFSSFIGAMILMNCIFIGIQTDYAASTWQAKAVPFFVVSEFVFAFIFLLELILRISAYRCEFFTGSDMTWNLFDTTLILSQAVEQGITAAIIYKSGGLQDLDLSQLTDDVVVLRALRIFRLLRILRILRIMHISGELQAITTAVMKGLRSFLWTVIFLLLLLYAVGVFITQSVTDFKISLESRGSLDPELGDYFGSLAETMLALFQAVTDGQEWREMLKPLMTEISPWMAVPFCMYISFTVFALLNILTGIFVDSALQNGQEEKRRFLLQEVGQLFLEADKEQMTWVDFQAQLENPHLQQLFAALDVTEEDASMLFHMLDASHEGHIQADEFLNGCLRLDGPAKAIDLAAFMEESRKVNRTFLTQVPWQSRCTKYGLCRVCGPSKALVPSSDALVPSNFLFLVTSCS
ncbi:unnamed protein product [Durusdinium trenchii]|uniref:Uncharacterized protein n=2 Tax=Durusdinium trenchii TaxID=1381693 RepID=A0ABP0MDG4_9DINO